MTVNRLDGVPLLSMPILHPSPRERKQHLIKHLSWSTTVYIEMDSSALVVEGTKFVPVLGERGWLPMTVPPMVSSLECQYISEQLSRTMAGTGADASVINAADNSALRAHPEKGISNSMKTPQQSVRPPQESTKLSGKHRSGISMTDRQAEHTMQHERREAVKAYEDAQAEELYVNTSTLCVIEPEGLPVYKDLHLNWDQTVEEEDCGSEGYEDEHDHSSRAYDDYIDMNNSLPHSPRRSVASFYSISRRIGINML